MPDKSQATSVLITGFADQSEAELFVEWLIRQGEQDASVYMMEADNQMDGFETVRPFSQYSVVNQDTLVIKQEIEPVYGG